MITFEINFGALKGTQRISKKRVEKLLLSTENVLKLKGEREMSIAFVSKEEISNLNESYYGGTGTTDVLAFPSQEPYAKNGYLGEVLIYYPRAKSQAKSRGVPAIEEVQVLLVHGLLHLLGHDHETSMKKSRMFRLQDRIIETK